ncbi:DUF4476 domain-containing protein [Aridibaculum aurantiacum]|uniref:DUF4476 domain-containing protein n=1 Tax=Aridibaculum aurantiacum TaxID=2810307 RepID=UPI001A9593BD|nr:DUF4476 domain-containing protein [Aridibaculum aurantiacum]
MKYLLHLLLLLTTSSAFTQEKRFLFIQSENRQPFYVSINNKIYSSSASGYVIIPKLADGEYKFSVGFAKSEVPEQSFVYNINKKDVGLSLKNFGEKGWGLFNLQSFAVSMAGETKVSDVAKAPAREEAAPISFEARKEPTVAKDKLATEQVVQAVSQQVQAAPVVQPGLVKAADPVDKAVAKEEKRKQTATTNTNISKVSEQAGSEGVSVTFVDRSGSASDTIQVVIPSQDVFTSVQQHATKNESSNKPAVEVQASKVSPPAADNKFLNVGATSHDGRSGETTNEVSAPNNTSVFNSHCKAIASDEDYTKLRRRMAQETTDEDMMKEARKLYKNKCVTTAQVRALSSLFLSDEGRYNFFQSSINSVSDPHEYADLVKEFIDPTFAERFKSLMR